MKPRLQQALENMQRHNAGVMSRECFGFEPEEVYDALVVAPGWKPDKTILDPSFTVTQLTQHAYFSGFLVEKEGVKIAWAQTASGACNVLDHILICAELQFKQLIFAGAAGGLVPDYPVGTICTPKLCFQGSYAGAYLADKLTGFTPFSPVYPPDGNYVDRVIALGRRMGHPIRRAKVFCTDSIALEYSHLDEIRSTGAELIEMETALFYQLEDLFEVPAVALLAESDNSATGAPLLGREEPNMAYRNARGRAIPDLIYHLAKEDA
jgi:purine-nucleoside phosphorylase